MSDQLHPDRSRIDGPQHAVVVDNVDPTGRHRVRFRIPGRMKLSPWAYSLTAGSGSPDRGASMSYDIGADIAVMFVGGDQEFPVVLGGWWGIAHGDKPAEAPAPLKDAGDQGHLVSVFQDGTFRMVVDRRERAGTEAEPTGQLVVIEDTATGDGLTWDLSLAALMIRGTMCVSIKSDGAIQIEAPTITLNGRTVLASPAPI